MQRNDTPFPDDITYYLGRLCKRGHDWNGTGQSLRRRALGTCLQCDPVRGSAPRRYRQGPPPEPANGVEAERRCTYCHKLLKRRKSEDGPAFDARETCSELCARRLEKRRIREATYTPLDQHLCHGCGVLLEPRPGEPPHEFRNRKTCGPACVAMVLSRVHKRATPTKTCPVCSQTMHRHANEHPWKFARRETCSWSCRSRRPMLNRARITPYPREWQEIAERIRQRDGNVCQLCGASPGKRALPVHHVDYDPTHCAADNLITLCDRCHAKTNMGSREEWIALFRRMLLAEEISA